MKRAAAFLVLILGCLGLGVTVADAGSPEPLITWPIDETNVVAECDGFQVLDHVTGELNVTASYDKDGLLERLVTETRGRHDIRNSVKNVAVSSSYNRRFVTAVDAGRTLITGPSYHVTVPGHGAVLIEAGAIMFENGEFRAVGRHDAMSGDTQRICAAFA